MEEPAAFTARWKEVSSTTQCREVRLDFYCPECRLAVELDGEAHFTSIRAEHDAARDEFIRSLKIRTVRFENRLVLENLEGVLETIKEHLK